MIEKRETVLGAGLKWFIILILSSFILVFVFEFGGTDTESTDAAFDYVMLVILAVVGLVSWHSLRIAQRIKGRKDEFKILLANHESITGTEDPGFTTLFRTPEQRDAKYINTMSGDKWRYGDFTHNIYRKTKYGEYKAVEVYNSVLELDLPRKLPHLFFDAPDARGLQFIPYLYKSQKTSLEGDFDNHFVTYFPHHYHIDARSIISPEVMAAMIDSGVSDIEILNDKLYMYSALMPVGDIPKFIAEGQQIQRKLSDHIVYYRDEKLFDSKNRKDVAIFGKALRKRPRFPWVLLVFMTGFLVLPALMYQGEGSFSFEYLAYQGVFFVSFIYDAYKNWWKVKQTNARMEQSYLNKVAAHKRRVSQESF